MEVANDLAVDDLLASTLQTSQDREQRQQCLGLVKLGLVYTLVNTLLC